jgi:hypothetical protein
MLFGSAGGVPLVTPAVAAAAAAAAAQAKAAATAATRAAADAALAAQVAAAPNAPDDAFTALARARMAADTAIAEAGTAANAADPYITLAHIDLVIDDFIANYSSADWVFRGQPLTVKRALKITYRYQVVESQQQPPRSSIPGAYATEHILIGYAGGNGSA